ncbi:Aste57867_22528 [Aphanomyces stellatus]|uniref:Geranylgeranyl transferase type II subunit beta n=1 Tax=Aphanomyces stellatus TaxID=120398 RepID=A0A485LM55_9STRA|nr:hypothetical protein As57867_022458 [Aphanomyces stellatus]VFT99188.1 Aste57867_22528 [Aphanomyces stellatus]
MDAAMAFIKTCRNFNFGYGNIPGCESHSGHIFTAVGALFMGQQFDKYVDVDVLGRWLCERQRDSWGLNGRPEKQADICNSSWNISCLVMMGRETALDQQGQADSIHFDKDGTRKSKPTCSPPSTSRRTFSCTHNLSREEEIVRGHLV